MNILYLNKIDIGQTGILEGGSLPRVWDKIEEALSLLGSGKAIAPLDLYLRPKKEGYVDRIIAKAAFIGKKEDTGTEIAGLKWIGSAPLNFTRGLERASGIIILNDPVTGQVISIMDAAPINALRTAAVSMIALKELKPTFRKLVIFGAGVIGKEHLRQVLEASKLNIFPNLCEIDVFDMQETKSSLLVREYQTTAVKCNIKIRQAALMKDCFTNETAVIIATNALMPYLEQESVEGRNELVVINVSLRDYYPEALAGFNTIVVDSWDHVAREGTSLEQAYKKGLINKNDCLELISLLAEKTDTKNKGNVIINPMGIAVTDLAIGLMIFKEAKQKAIGTMLF